MLRFEDPIFLWLLLVIPLLVLIRLYNWRQRRRKLQKFGDLALLKMLMPDVSSYRPTIKFGLIVTALGMLILMLARPQMGTRISHEKREGIDSK